MTHTSSDADAAPDAGASPDGDADADGTPDSASRARPDEPPIAEKPYKIVFEGGRCFGAGKCAAVASNWEMDLSTGLARPKSSFVGEDELAENVEAAEVCPAKKGDGVIHVVDRETGAEIAPDPEGDGTLSLG